MDKVVATAAVKRRAAPTANLVQRILEKGKKIGVGAYREVYKADFSDWVVKREKSRDRNPVVFFDQTPWVNSSGGNDTEYATYKRAMQNLMLPEGVLIPEMYLINDCIVAQYIDGIHPDPCYRHSYGKCSYPGNCWIDKVKNIPISDMHSKNIIITPGGKIYLVDLGHGTF